MSTGLHRAAVADSLASLQAAAGATANGTALDVKGWDGVLFQVTGATPVGTITFEGSADDGTTWVSIEAYNIADGTVATTTTAVGDFVAVCSGLSNVRARLTFTSGTWTVGARAFPGAAAAALVGSSATSGGTSNVNVAKINNVTPLMGAGNTGTGSPRVTIATDQAAVAVTANPATSGGLTIYRNLDAGVTGAVVKNGAGQLYSGFVSNNAATARFVKVYDKATAPTQADTPVLTFQIPAASGGNPVPVPTLGVAFTSGISIRASTGVADNDTGATSTNDVIVNLFYK